MGRWGRAWCGVLQGQDAVNVTAVAGRQAAREGFKLPGARVFSDYREALAESDVDAVIVTLPIALHLDCVRESIALGLSVLSEKPLVQSRAELVQLLDLVRGATAPVRVNQNYRLRPWVSAVRKSLPELGSLERVGIHFAQPEFVAGGRDRLANPLIADMSIHHMDLLRHLTGREAEVRSASASRPADCVYAGSAGVDADLELVGGVPVSYMGTWATRGSSTPWDGDWAFIGEHGTLTVTDLAVDLNLGDGPRRVVIAQPPVEDEDLGWAWSDFARAIDGDQTAGVTVEDNARSLQLVFDLAELADVPNPWAILDNGGF